MPAPDKLPWRLLVALPCLIGAPLLASTDYALSDAEQFLNTYCVACHQGDSAAAGFRTDNLAAIESFRDRPDDWTRLTARVANSEMPPKGVPAPELDAREAFLDWAADTWRTQACAADIAPEPSLLRRLNRDEYAATVRDLFNLQIDVSETLPIDGPGGEGFDNAAETLFLSPLHSEKYIETAKFIIDAASKEFKSRRKIFIARPGKGVGEREAAHRILAAFLPEAFRQPVDEETVALYVDLFGLAREQGRDFEPAIFFALRSALASPRFLFHVEPRDATTRQYALASRLSYFLWGSMPDELLFDVAAAGKMDDPAVLERLVPRMLRDPRSLEFATRFVEQWLRTRELEGAHGPDHELFPQYATDEELRSDIRLQPVFFFQEVLRVNHPVLNFLDSESTILTRSLAELFEIKDAYEEGLSKNPEWMELPPNSGRGGLLGMPAVLAISSHPYRTSPVLRGAWILDSVLGSPPPPPPPDVPPLDESPAGEAPKSVRERLTLHRDNPVCASCHNRIDPLGFALDNYDVLGRWRVEEGGTAIDAAATLSDGKVIDGPGGLKSMLLDRRELFLRNLSRRMLGYALGRGLTPADACAVETIVDRVEKEEYAAWALVRQIVLSEPFLLTAESRLTAEGRP